MSFMVLIRYCTNLQSLKFSRSVKLSDEAVKALSGSPVCSSLTALDLSCNLLLTRAIFPTLLQLTSLEQLDLNSCRRLRLSLPEPSQAQTQVDSRSAVTAPVVSRSLFGSLRCLNLAGLFNLDDNTFIRLLSLLLVRHQQAAGAWYPSLEELDVSGRNRLSDHSLAAIANYCKISNANLKKLCLRNCSFSKGAIQSLLSSVGFSLRYLDLGKCRFTPAPLSPVDLLRPASMKPSIAVAYFCPRLVHIDLTDIRVADDFFHAMAHSPELHSTTSPTTMTTMPNQSNASINSHCHQVVSIAGIDQPLPPLPLESLILATKTYRPKQGNNGLAQGQGQRGQGQRQGQGVQGQCENLASQIGRLNRPSNCMTGDGLHLLLLRTPQLKVLELSGVSTLTTEDIIEALSLCPKLIVVDVRDAPVLPKLLYQLCSKRSENDTVLVPTEGSSLNGDGTPMTPPAPQPLAPALRVLRFSIQVQGYPLPKRPSPQPKPYPPTWDTAVQAVRHQRPWIRVQPEFQDDPSKIQEGTKS